MDAGATGQRRTTVLRNLAMGALLAVGAIGAATVLPACRRGRSAPLDPRAAAGAELFTKYCALCHGPDAKGYAADHAPSLVTETFLATATDVFLSRSIREGRPGTAMAPYGRERGGPLTNEEVAAIIAFLRTKGPSRMAPAPGISGGTAARGQATYDANCKRCHGTPEARGEAVHLANSAFLSAASDNFLRYAIVHGRPGTPMVAFEGKLDPQAIADVVRLIRSWATPPPKAPVPAPPMPPEPPLQGPIVINPEGKAPSFTLRDDRFVPADQVKQALDAKNRIIIIDARPGSEWILAHIPGAISVSYYQTARLDSIPKDDTWVVAYCACPHHASGMVVDELRKRGFPNTAILDEGILEWQRRQYPMEGSRVNLAASASASVPPPKAPLPKAPPSPKAPIHP
jgi:mono/diheme cytochrome c family protein/rhodanese-related sulfurtransferase